MGKNLIHNYLNNLNNSQTQQQQFEKKNNRSYFGVPSVSSTIEAFDQESDKLIKPLDGKGHLVNSDLVHMPKEFVRDTIYTTKALADGVRGKANDHQLGKLNDLGLKLSGIAIATYLMTRKATPKTKAMEFIGFGTFLASMALWPKLALEIPARIVHGFNFRKQYVDEQGRKKYVSQDPNYIPFDLYKGDKKSENLDVIGDRLGIRRDIPNRHEAVKEQMRKISVQNNTLWMLTAGIATPLMTALTCNFAEPYVGKIAEKYTNKKVNEQIDQVDKYLNNQLDGEKTKVYESKVLDLGKPSEVEPLTRKLQGKIAGKEDLAEIADIIAKGQDVEMKEAARADIESIIGGEKYVVDYKTPNRLAETIHKEILKGNPKLAETITAQRLEAEISQGIVRGAVRDLLTEVGTMLDGTSQDKVATNFKCKDTEILDFFAKPEGDTMSPVERLTHNIKSIIMKVNNSNTSEDFISGMSELENSEGGKELKARIDAKLSEGAERIAKGFYEGQLGISEGRENYIRKSVQQLYKSNAQRGPKSDKLFANISGILSAEHSQRRGFMLTEGAAEKLVQAEAAMRNFSAVDNVLAQAAHFKLEKASETLVANHWNQFSELLVKELGFTDKEIKDASRNKMYSNKLFAEKLEAICSDDTRYKEFITKIGKKMIELDEKIDVANDHKTGRMMNKVEGGITTNCERAKNVLEGLGMTSMKEKMYSYRNDGMDTNPGSIMSSKIRRLHSRMDGVHNSYMRILQTAEFFHRTSKYDRKLKANGGILTPEIAKEFGLAEDAEMNEQIIKKGRELLLDAHTNKFYTKDGLHNNKNFFKTLMWSLFRTNKDSAQWNENWSSCVMDDTVSVLDNIEGITTRKPRRVFEDVETKSLGQKLREHMNYMYGSLGKIERKVLGQGKENILTDGHVDAKDALDCKRFDLLGKTPNDWLHDTLKQKYNSAKWMKMFAPILGVTAAVTIVSQFFFGKKDSDIKA